MYVFTYICIYILIYLFELAFGFDEVVALGLSESLG